MLNCFITESSASIIPLNLVLQTEYAAWLAKQDPFIKHWLDSTGFRNDAGSVAMIPNATGQLSTVICCVKAMTDFWSVGSLPFLLPSGCYRLNVTDSQFAIAWGLGSYQYTRYKKSLKKPAQLLVESDLDYVTNIVESIYLVRDLINTPTDDMGPSELADAAVALAKPFNAVVKQIVGEDLLKENYASIYTVGRACDDAPRLIDLRWGDKKHPKVTLVGKGVCFDTGGLNIKVAGGMTLMKKDMGGAAHVLGLARMIMEAKLPIQLRVLIPAVENSVSGNAYRPGDVITSRKGLTIEVGNTDAEGRVVLADALTEAASENPELLIDIATLTGAARVALGTELPAMFTNDEKLAADITAYGVQEQDPVWRLPLFALYRDALNSSIADINNNTADGYAGAITAALFLKEFVPNEMSWVHFDLMAWNVKARPGRPQGGEAMGVRGLFSYLNARYKK
ncbi:MAG: leucyl aminopeptidase family protein [Gammaproteobacteria bacterium]|nr:leucyl aminopeptidase family protein [Gammaproteobacteria bacterium]